METKKVKMESTSSTGVESDESHFPKIESVHYFDNGHLLTINVSEQESDQSETSTNKLQNMLPTLTDQPSQPYMNPNGASKGLPPLPIPIPIPIPLLPPMFPFPHAMPMPLPIPVPIPMFHPATYNGFIKPAEQDITEIQKQRQRHMLYGNIVRSRNVNITSNITNDADILSNELNSTGRQTKREYPTVDNESSSIKDSNHFPCKAFKKDSAKEFTDNDKNSDRRSYVRGGRLSGTIVSNTIKKGKVEVIVIDDEEEFEGTESESSACKRKENDENNESETISNVTKDVDLSEGPGLVKDKLLLNSDDSTFPCTNQPLIPCHEMRHSIKNFSYRNEFSSILDYSRFSE